MWKERYEDLCIGGVFLAFTVFYVSQIPYIRVTNLAPMNSEVYPKIVTALLFFLSGLQIAVGIKKILRADPDKKTQAQQKEYTTVIRTFFLTVVYILLLEPLGFFISSTLYVFLQIVLLCPPDKVRLGRFAGISLVVSAVVYGIFRYGLDLMLPAGPLVEWF